MKGRTNSNFLWLLVESSRDWGVKKTDRKHTTFQQSFLNIANLWLWNFTSGLDEVTRIGFSLPPETNFKSTKLRKQPCSRQQRAGKDDHDPWETKNNMSPGLGGNLPPTWREVLDCSTGRETHKSWASWAEETELRFWGGQGSQSSGAEYQGAEGALQRPAERPLPAFSWALTRTCMWRNNMAPLTKLQGSLGWWGV